MKNFTMLYILLLFISSLAGFSQVAINTTGNSADPSAILDVDATDKGLLIPRVSLNSIADNILPVNSPANGLMVYNTGGNMTPGIYIWNGQNWATLATIEQVLNSLPPAGGSGIFGEIYEYNAIGTFSNISIPDDGTFVQWTSGTQGDVSGMGFASSSLIIENGGTYSIAFNSAVQVSTGGKIVDAALFVNGIRQDDLHGRAWFKEGNKSQHVTFSGIISLLADDVVSLSYTMDDDSIVRVEIANLSLTKID